MMSLRIDAHREVWSNKINLRIAEVVDGKLYLAKPVEFSAAELTDGDYVNPCISFNQTEAQTLMDALWFCGVRPTEGSGSAGSLKATQDHLKDMQKIAFHFLESK